MPGKKELKVYSLEFLLEHNSIWKQQQNYILGKL